MGAARTGGQLNLKDVKSDAIGLDYRAIIRYIKTQTTPRSQRAIE